MEGGVGASMGWDMGLVVMLLAGFIFSVEATSLVAALAGLGWTRCY